MDFRKETAKWGKNLACKYLKENNYKIKQKDFLCTKGEIDIIADDLNKKELVFIKVKTCSKFKYGNPIYKNGLQNTQAIKYYINKNCIKSDNIRNDIVEVHLRRRRI